MSVKEFFKHPVRSMHSFGDRTREFFSRPGVKSFLFGLGTLAAAFVVASGVSAIAPALGLSIGATKVAATVAGTATIFGAYKIANKRGGGAFIAF